MNRLKVNQENSIITLHKRGLSVRRIARELGIHRETVGRVLQRSKPAKVTIGLGVDSGINPEAISCEPEPSSGSKPASALEVTIGSRSKLESKPAKVTIGKEERTRSRCEPFRSVIEEGMASGLSATRIYQDLREGHGYEGGYESVKRFVRELETDSPLPFRRMETGPGEEMQVDFGQGAPVIDAGKKRRPHVFRATLSFSRKGYSEVVWRQDTESFLRCLENAFRHFGGVCKAVVVDNLKAAVLHADWFDPELNPKLVEFAQYYGTVVLPTKPRTPQHKGKVEAGVKYVQNNALKGRTFPSLGRQNEYLEHWERNVADKRIHGTVREQVETLFNSRERPALEPLPEGLFPSFHEARRRVHRDGYVEYRRAYYSVPPEYLSRDVWVRGDSRLLRVFSLQMKLIAVHTLVEAGRFATHDAHLHAHKRNRIEQGADHLLGQCQAIGEHTAAWASAMYHKQGPLGMRAMQGLLALARKHPVARLERACQSAHRHACFRLRDVRRLIEAPDNVVQLDFLQEHELIRDLSAYRLETLTHLP